MSIVIESLDIECCINHDDSSQSIDVSANTNKHYIYIKNMYIYYSMHASNEVKYL